MTAVEARADVVGAFYVVEAAGEFIVGPEVVGSVCFAEVIGVEVPGDPVGGTALAVVGGDVVGSVNEVVINKCHAGLCIGGVTEEEVAVVAGVFDAGVADVF